MAHTQHEASCPDVAPKECSEQEIPVHNHNQKLLVINWNHNFVYMLTSEWQIGLQLPFQMRQVRISYQLQDGSDYTPPYAGLHHRDEDLWGIGDPQIFTRSIFWFQSWGVMPQIGTTIPLGRIEDNPYFQAQENEFHQHIQMGTGTFVPSLSLTIFLDESQWGMLHSVSQDIPMYENKNNYTPGMNTNWSLGYWKRVHPKYILMSQIRGKHESPERWMDLPYGGQDALAINLATLIRIHPLWEIGAQIEKNLWIQSRESEEEALNPSLIWNLSITYQ